MRVEPPRKGSGPFCELSPLSAATTEGTVRGRQRPATGPSPGPNPAATLVSDLQPPELRHKCVVAVSPEPPEQTQTVLWRALLKGSGKAGHTVFTATLLLGPGAPLLRGRRTQYPHPQGQHDTCSTHGRGDQSGKGARQREHRCCPKEPTEAGWLALGAGLTGRNRK